MTAVELFNLLAALPKNAEVLTFWDGEPRGGIEGVFVHSGDDFTSAGSIVLVGDWCIYRDRVAKKHQIIAG